MVPARNRGLFLVLAGIACVLAATHLAYRPTQPLGADASPYSFSAYRVKRILVDLVGSGVPHPIGSPDAARVRDLITKRLAVLGYSTELQAGLVCNDEGVCGSPVNVIARLGTGSPGADAVLLSAHYDSVAAGPGASDDGAGVATVLEIARILALRPAPRHPVILLLNEGEEAGLLGALLFVRAHPLSKTVKAVVNLDARGTSGASLMFETGSANSWAMRLFASAIPRPATNSLYYVGYELLPNNTDFSVFKAADYQGFNFAFIGGVGRYHTPLDNWANVSSSSIQQQGDSALATLWALANAATLRAPAGESVFFDVFSRTLIRWPADFTLPAAIATLLLLLLETVILLRKRALGGLQLLWGWAGTLAVLVLGAALTGGILASLIVFGKVPPIDGASWIAHPLPMSIAAAAIAFLAAAAVAAWLVRRAGYWGFWAAATMLNAVLSVACAAMAPGASFVFLLPACAAAVTALPFVAGVLDGRVPTGWSVDAAALIPALAVFVVVLPLASFLYTALGSVGWPVSTLLLCLATTEFLPLIAAASRRVRQRAIMLAALLTVGGTLATVVLPTYSVSWPERINFEYWLDADTGTAHWLAQTDSSRLPAQIARAANFDPLPHPHFEGSSSPRFYAPAPARVLAAPELTQSAAPSPGSSPLRAAPAALPASATATTHYELRLRSPRGAPGAVAVFPASAKVREITVLTAAGTSRYTLHRLEKGATLLEVVGLSPQGLQFGIDAAYGKPLAVQIFDQSYDFDQGQFLQRARPIDAASSQDGDLTVVHRTVSLDPAPGR